MKNTMKKIGGLLALSFLLNVPNAFAVTITVVDFEGIAEGTQVGGFYAGSFGLTFTNAVAAVDSDAGGTGSFGGEPSPSTGIFVGVVGGPPFALTMSSTTGFTTGFSFFYSATAGPDPNFPFFAPQLNVQVFSGLNGTGSLLSGPTILPSPTPAGPGDPTGFLSPFQGFGVSFAGTAKSVVISDPFFGGIPVVFDNFTLGSQTPIPGPGGVIPEPSTMLLFGTGLVGLVAWRWRAKQAQKCHASS